MDLKDYRTARKTDLQFICDTLVAGQKIVLVRSLMRPEQEPYPLLDICEGPFRLNDRGLWGMSLKGVVTTLRITDGEFPYVELQDRNTDWYPPEQSSVILLIPKNAR